MNPFSSEGFFEKFPDIEILADPKEMKYRVTYTECLSQGSCVRFERRTKLVDKKTVQDALSKIISWPSS